MSLRYRRLRHTGALNKPPSPPETRASPVTYWNMLSDYTSRSLKRPSLSTATSHRSLRTAPPNFSLVNSTSSCRSSAVRDENSPMCPLHRTVDTPAPDRNCGAKTAASSRLRGVIAGRSGGGRPALYRVRRSKPRPGRTELNRTATTPAGSAKVPVAVHWVTLNRGLRPPLREHAFQATCRDPPREPPALPPWRGQAVY